MATSALPPEAVAQLLQSAGAMIRAELSVLPDSVLTFHPAPGEWCVKEVLGHLIDSALNNYHRVIRAQGEAELRFPDYDQRHWVDAGAYEERAWEDLVQLWAQLNRQLAHAIARVAHAALGRLCHIGAGAPVTLEDVVRDYPRHLRHHLRQILDAEEAKGRTHPPFTSR